MAKKEKQSKLEPDAEKANQEESKENGTSDEKVEEEHESAESEGDSGDFALQLNKQTLARTFAIILAIGLGVIVAIAINNQRMTMAAQEPFAVVDGEELTAEDVEEFKSSFPRDVSDEVVQENLILRELLLREAEQLNISVSTEEAEEELSRTLELGGTNLSEYQRQQEDTYRATLELIRQQQLQRSVLDALSANVTVEADTMIVRHILIGTQNRTNAEAEALAQDVEQDVERNPEEFCDFVQELSADTPSVGDCGEYEVTRQSQFVPAFKDAAFELEADEVTTVESQFGFHVIRKEGERISQQAVAQAILPRLEEKYNVQRLDQESTEDTSPEPSVTVANNTSEQPESSNQQREPAETTSEETETEPSTSSTTVANSDLAQCLQEAQATLYTVSWSPETDRQLDILDEAVSGVTHIECEASEENEQACNQAGITTYPTWVLNGQETIGLKTQTALKAILDC